MRNWRLPALHRWFASRFGARESASPRPDSPGPPSWSEEKISDSWFRDHFMHAASVVGQWLDRGKSVNGMALLDFGCGDGITDLALALKYRPRKVTGVDITATFLTLAETARHQLGLQQLPENLFFRRIDEASRLAGSLEADAIISWSAFEHIDRQYLDEIVADLFDLLPSGGLFFLQIEPLFYSPFGSHLGRFIKEPWAHLLWDEQRLRQAVLDCVDNIPENEKEFNFYTRSFADYKSFIYGEYLKLNKLTVNEITDIFREHGFETVQEEKNRVTLSPPDMLLRRFPEQDLVTNEIRLLLRKP